MGDLITSSQPHQLCVLFYVQQLYLYFESGGARNTSEILDLFEKVPTFVIESFRDV